MEKKNLLTLHSPLKSVFNRNYIFNRFDIFHLRIEGDEPSENGAERNEFRGNRDVNGDCRDTFA